MIDAFKVIRVLSQLAEAISSEVLDGRSPKQVLKAVKKLSDRAEHIAQEFIPGGYALNPESANTMRDSLLQDIHWVLEIITIDEIRDALTRTSYAHPKTAELSLLASSIETSLNCNA
nr:hypothetical protein [Pseudomonas alcaligenes]